MCKNSLFIPQSMKSKHSFLFYFKIAKELSEFRNYLFIVMLGDKCGITETVAFSYVIMKKYIRRWY